ncbi:Uncharacterised protein [Mycobacterium tuberculosis]|nr:Uncharacterised protein [Mycobacterium tuberculosis]
MADGNLCRKQRVASVVKVFRQNTCGAHNLVSCRYIAQRSHVHSVFCFNGDMKLKQVVGYFNFLLVAQTCDLPEGRLVVAAVGTKHAAVNLVFLLEKNAHLELREQFADALLHVGNRNIQLARNKNMGNGKALIVSELAVQAGIRQFFLPQRSGDVRQNAAAIPFAINKT